MDLEKTVSIVPCHNYNFSVVQENLVKLLEPFDGLKHYFGNGSRVLIKPNLLTGVAPEKVVTTHPAVIKALILTVQKTGAQVFVGDSPMRGPLDRVASTAGILDIVKETQASLLPFNEINTVNFPGGNVCKSFPLAAEALEMDFIINAGKFKTHALTGLSLAVKNCYGFLASKDKLFYHARYPSVHNFADFLLDLYLTIKPGFSLIDGVVAMQGPGPRKGRPKPLGVLLASPNAVALDAVSAELAGFTTKEVITLQAAARRNISGHDLRTLKIIGPLERLRAHTFDKGTSTGGWSFLWRYAPAWARHFQQRRRPWPRIGTACNRCGTCLQHCPVGIMKFVQDDRGAEELFIDYTKCLRCYCCHEICPQGAINLINRRGG